MVTAGFGSHDAQGGRAAVVVLLVVVVVGAVAAFAYKLRSDQNAAAVEAHTAAIQAFFNAYARRDIDGMERSCASRYGSFFAQLRQVPRERVTAMFRWPGSSIGDIQIVKTDYDSHGTARVEFKFEGDAQPQNWMAMLAQEGGQWKVVGVGGLTVDGWLTD